MMSQSFDILGLRLNHPGWCLLEFPQAKRARSSCTQEMLQLVGVQGCENGAHNGEKPGSSPLVLCRPAHFSTST